LSPELAGLGAGRVGHERCPEHVPHDAVRHSPAHPDAVPAKQPDRADREAEQRDLPAVRR